jgi:hypothetical protein
MQNFHRSIAGPIGLQILDTAPSDPFSAALGSIFAFPGQVLGAITSVAHDVITLPTNIAHEAGNAFTGGIGAVGGAATNIAHEAGGAVGNVTGAAKDIMSSPILLIGGAAVLLILLSR